MWHRGLARENIRPRFHAFLDKSFLIQGDLGGSQASLYYLIIRKQSILQASLFVV